MTPTTPGPEDTTGAPEPRFRDRPVVRDAFYALIFMFPAAALVTLVYRFRVPFDGYVAGPSGVWDAILATLVYGLMGGFVVVPVLAGIASALLRRGDRAPSPRLLTIAPVGAALLYALLIALT